MTASLGQCGLPDLKPYSGNCIAASAISGCRRRLNAISFTLLFNVVVVMELYISGIFTQSTHWPCGWRQLSWRLAYLLSLVNYISNCYHGKRRADQGLNAFVVSLQNIMSLSRLLSRTATLSRGAWSSRILPARPALRAPYSAAAGLSRDAIQTRILDVLKGLEKVDQSKVGPLFKPHTRF